MKYINLGKSALRVSRICVGGMSFGDATLGNHTWVLNQEETTAVVKRALELGINFFDTANCYSEGTSEIYLGNALRSLEVDRKDIVLATKVYFNEGKLSHDAILREVDKSLERLQTSYIDLLIIHRFDYDTPILETMKALDEVVRKGKVRYIGASAMYAYQFLKMQECARQNGLTEFISMQNHYNLIYREDERELFKLLKEEGVSSTPYSPLAAGRLSRSWDANTKRSNEDVIAKEKYDSEKTTDIEIVKRVANIANKYKTSQSIIALAWLLSKEIVASPIVGITKIKYLEEAVAATNVTISQEDIDYLEELYSPHRVVGALDKN